MSELDDLKLRAAAYVVQGLAASSKRKRKRAAAIMERATNPQPTKYAKQLAKALGGKVEVVR